jgi:hypothetical protein
MKAMLTAALFYLASVTAVQQPVTGTITGLVSDPANARIPGVTVAASGGGRTVTTITNEEGVYTLNVPPGVYRISAWLPGFTPASGEVTVAAGATAQLPLTLRIDPGLSPFNLPVPPFRFDRPFEITADRQTRQGSILQYRGNVRIRTETVTVMADEADFNVNTQQFDLRGNVRVRVLPAVPRYIPLGN